MTVNYDNQDLFPGLYKKFGAFALAQVLSHEWGHVIQTEAGTEFPATILAEQQADCFAGAFVAHVDNGDSRLLKLDPVISYNPKDKGSLPKCAGFKTSDYTTRSSIARTRTSWPTTAV